MLAPRPVGVRRPSIILVPNQANAPCPCADVGVTCGDCTLHIRARSCSPEAVVTHGCICGALSPMSKLVALKQVVPAGAAAGVQAMQCSACKGVVRR